MVYVTRSSKLRCDLLQRQGTFQPRRRAELRRHASVRAIVHNAEYVRHRGRGTGFLNEASQPAHLDSRLLPLFCPFHGVLREEMSMQKSSVFVFVKIVNKTTLVRASCVEDVWIIDRGD